MKKGINELILLIIGFLFISSNLRGQVIQGKLIDSSDGRPLAYVNVGVVNISRGTITNEKGGFELICSDLSQDAEVRFSMIGYESQTYILKDLLFDPIIIRLDRKAIELEELVFEWHGSTRTIGTSKISKTGGVCGWGLSW